MVNAAPTDQHHTAAQLATGVGFPLPYGATVIDGGINFSVFSNHAQACTLVLYRPGEPEPFAELPFPDHYRIGNAFAMQVYDIDPATTEYGFRMAGAHDPENGHRFDDSRVLLDPYAKAISGRDTWRAENPLKDTPYPYRARVIQHEFDWEGDTPLHTPLEDLVIYEMHVRSFTAHESSGVKERGTYAGMIERIPYLKELGVNCVELMPIFDFDEWEHWRKNEETGELLVNYWGYSTVGFFAPKAGFAAGDEISELKALVKALHQNGIEVLLDVVFNHTGEGNENGPTISFRGIDNQTYYMLTPEGYYYNFSGTGNTFNCNQPVVINFILDCLRYWVTEYHVDGFRFDLASILARNEFGAPLEDPPLLKALAFDPVLGKSKLIAEPWDAGGLYHVGAFPSYGRWSEWNGKYRDCLRKFLKGDAGQVEEMIQRLMGSPDLYPDRGAIASINFVTAHDGFTLADMVAYNDKHNEANLENNQDGFNDNNSWNCGVEGVTDDPAINALRRRQMRNAFTMLMVSMGVPMFLMGDEVARSQNGNNNTYCQDNALNYLDYTAKETNADLFRFFRLMIAFRMTHPVLRGSYHPRFTDYNKVGVPDMAWFSTEKFETGKPDERLTIAYFLGGAYAKGGLAQDNDIYVMLNMHWDDQPFDLPKLPFDRHWHVAVNTAADSPDDIAEPGQEKPVNAKGGKIKLKSRSVMVLIAK
ncbi:MAG: glycogen debranching protein GlgX [Anaerolinea sp.]|nr:glycogen debranching protein GlgX [Anaerolinea sp.]